MRLQGFKPAVSGFSHYCVMSDDYVAGLQVEGEKFQGIGRTPQEAEQAAKSAYEAATYARKDAMLRSIEATRLGQLPARPGFGRMPALTGCL